MSCALVLTLATGGGAFELAGTRWLSVRSVARLLLGVAVLAAVETGLQWRAWRARLATSRQSLVSSLDRALLLVIVAGVALRLTEYVAPSIRLFPFLVTERTFERFLLANLFVVAASLCLYALGRRVEDPRTGLLAVVVFTLSPWTIYWGRFHVQQTAALAMATLAAVCFLGWLHGRGPVGLALASGVVAIMLDPINFWLIGVGAAMVAAGSGRNRARAVLALAALLGLSALGRATFVPTADLWAPGVPAIGALSLGPATLFLLYDRVLTLLLPAGASLLFLLGMLGVTRRRDILIPAWAGVALAWTAWANNRHLAQADGYSAMVAAGSLAAARGASWILRRSSPRPTASHPQPGMARGRPANLLHVVGLRRCLSPDPLVEHRRRLRP